MNRLETPHDDDADTDIDREDSQIVEGMSGGEMGTGLYIDSSQWRIFIPQTRQNASS
uniref:Uncharacterized protein n=1 Tax=Heterorhabditis bacteriophora TaxID=37862 RepID=A0A1I7X0D8_HETBA